MNMNTHYTLKNLRTEINRIKATTRKRECPGRVYFDEPYLNLICGRIQLHVGWVVATLDGNKHGAETIAL